MSLEWHLERREAPHSQPTYHSVESERVESVDVIILVEGLVHNKEEEQNWKNNKMTQLKVVDSLIFIFSAIKKCVVYSRSGVYISTPSSCYSRDSYSDYKTQLLTNKP